jgi:hypothetical protein
MLTLYSIISKVLEQIAANLKDPKSPQRVNTRDARKALKDMTSALGNYFGFWKKYKGMFFGGEGFFEKKKIPETTNMCLLYNRL